MMASLFERLDKGRPPPAEEAISRSHKGLPPVEILLDWLVNYWTKPTITAREIYTWGPNCIRDKKTTLSLAQILVERGWLAPTETHQRNKQRWKIVREPNTPAAAESGRPT